MKNNNAFQFGIKQKPEPIRPMSVTNVYNSSKVQDLGDLGITSSSAELNILDGATLTVTELNYVDGVTSAIQTQLNARELLSNKATDFTTINNTLYPTVQAVNNAITTAVTGLLDYRGSYDASTNLFPATGGSGIAGAILTGDFWICSVGGTLGGVAVTAGDLIIATTNTPGQTAGNWDLIEHNLGAYVSSVSGTTNRITSTGGATPVIDISATFEALLGKVANPLSQFASTTSLQLKGVISDETGSGALVFGTSPNITTPTGIVKGDVGLGNADNTTDLNKPISTATQTALDLKVTGPASATDNALVRYDGTTGKLVQNSGATLADDITLTLTGADANIVVNTDSTTTQGLKIATSKFGIESNFDIAGGYAGYFHNDGTATASASNGVVRIRQATSGASGIALIVDNLGTSKSIDVLQSGTSIFSVNASGSIELGHTSDTTIARVSAGVVSIEGVNIVTTSSTDTLTNKTLTAPKFADLGYIADANGNEMLVFDTVASAINHWQMGNASGVSPILEVVGDSTNINAYIRPKGTGRIILGTAGNGNIVFFADQSIEDSSNNEFIKFTKTASAVNEVNIINAATGTGPTVGATGGDTDIDLNLAGKGTGIVKSGGVAVLTQTNTITGITNKTFTSPTFVTPVLGTPSSGALTNCTADGTNAVGFKEIPQNSQSAAYTLVLADSGKHIYHPSADTTARIRTIPANSSVAYPIGTALTFVNDTSGGVITIAITTDTLVLAGAGTTGSRTLAANGVATAIKMTSTRRMISGTGLT